MATLNKQNFRIKLKQGLEANINTDATKYQAVTGEPHYTTDTKQLYIFDGTENLRIPTCDTNGDILLPDSDKIFFGTGSDASILYNGTNLLINPKAVGSGYLNIQGQTLLDDKLMFTQTDGNEYIDSLADGYMDYGATTLHRFNQSIDITGNCEADTYSVGGVTGIDKSITVLDADGTTTHALVFTKGILTACTTT